MKASQSVSTGAIAMLLATLALVDGATQSHAQVNRGSRFKDAPTPAVLTSTEFRLHVAGHIVRGTTFWVAYGPLDGTFAILRLHSVGDGTFERRCSLPVGARATFSYLMGRGSVRTRLGEEPGNPVVTIRTVGPNAVSPARLLTVQWHIPIG